MSVSTDTPYEDDRTDRSASTARRFGALFGLGFLGILALVVTSAPELADLAESPDVPVSATVLAIATVVQSSILLAVAVLVGLYTAPKVGFRSHVLERVTTGEPIGPELRTEVKPAVGLGLVAGLVIVLAEFVLAPSPPTVGETADATAVTVLSSVPLRFLYGGITEELLLRWGFMSLVAFGLWWAVGRVRGADANLNSARSTPSSTLLWTAVFVSAIAFGIGHLPAAATLYGELTADVVAWIVLGNAIGGIAFGWLFWRYSLEAAMIAHASSHVVFVVLSLVIVMV
ncbi:CPBP family intramembrane glutamic endopeptidase [Natronoglomus mannanivorans]|uniref:CPBP family intramembrane metalloprotease n=1 Tax=Natronoglomus mannanivorans TaxID=2979990 RepID=A0AAP2YWD5_9EURY|nr:CPBP family intramembrane metalloprotease [Halobacteria archaeon AArc-xg1-1]